jgi:uncharacterized protein YdhG (YjbR/CyaY superfamily)
MNPASRNPKAVDAYIAACPPAVRHRLKAVRRAVRAAAPAAEETLSYGIPAYKQRGIVVYFAAHTAHIGLYPAPRTIPGFKRELAGYGGGKGTIQLPHDEPLPIDLIKRIVKYRVGANQKRAAARKTKK